MLWALTDHLGSVRDVVDSNGDLRIHREFDSFGNVTGETHYNGNGDAVTAGQAGFVDEAFGFTGRYFDNDTGLSNNLNRWYDPRVGRWLSEDPIGFAGGDANLYRYVGNSPTMSTDPYGFFPVNGWPGQPGVPQEQHPAGQMPSGWKGGVERLAQWFLTPVRKSGLTDALGIEDDMRRTDERLGKRKGDITDIGGLGERC